MSEASGQTVLVSGGSGFLGGWCVIELLRRGYDVRTTVRSLSREPQVRAAVGSQVDPGDGLTVLAAELMSDDGWAEAVAGCDYVLHVASPFPPAQPKDPDELIVPARELRVLRAALDADVKRVVLTSSVAAIRLADGAASRPLDEGDWTDPDAPGLTPYVRSKTIAELAAWELVRERGEEDRLAVVNPAAIFDPGIRSVVGGLGKQTERLLEHAGDARLSRRRDRRGSASASSPSTVPRRGAARRRPRRCRRGRSRTCSSARWRFSTRRPLCGRRARQDRALLGEGEDDARLGAAADRGLDRRNRRNLIRHGVVASPPKQGGRIRTARR